MKRAAIVKYPGSTGADDFLYVLQNHFDLEVDVVWHEQESFGNVQLVVIPGGFSFGDIIRPGALVKASPISAAVRRFSREGLVLGVGNGFQILCELGILPGTLLQNLSAQFEEKRVSLIVQKNKCKLAQHLTPGAALKMPFSCQYGRFYSDWRTYAQMEENEQIVFRYPDDDIKGLPQEKLIASIAGITNLEGNVLGMMCHPERAVEKLIGGEDGKLTLQFIKQ